MINILCNVQTNEYELEAKTYPTVQYIAISIQEDEFEIIVCKKAENLSHPHYVKLQYISPCSYGLRQIYNYYYCCYCYCYCYCYYYYYYDNNNDNNNNDDDDDNDNDSYNDDNDNDNDNDNNNNDSNVSFL